MNEVKSLSSTEINESRETAERFREIRPTAEITTEECDAFWNGVFSDALESDNPEENLETVLQEYFEDLRNRSEYPESIPNVPFEVSALKLRTPEENAAMRECFDDVKADLKKQWEEENGKLWPKYDHDVYSSSGKLIRKAGSDYDAHHIHPLGMGGNNEARNITPLSAEVHYDKQGVHSANSPYSRIDKALGGNGND